MAERERPVRQVGGGGDLVLELLRRAGPRPGVPAEREARVRDAVRAQWLRSTAARHRRRTALWVVAHLAAAALVLVVLGLPRLRPASPIAVGATVEVVRGDVRCGDVAGVCTPLLRLPYGSVVTCGEGGRVALRAAGGASLRMDAGTRAILVAVDRVRLERGALYLDNQGSGRTPGMVVETPLGSVREIGTQLEVRLLGDSLRVAVREGQARVERLSAAHTVEAGQEATWRDNGSITLAALAPDAAGWAWVQHVVAFELDGSSAAAFVRWVAREAGLSLAWASPEIEAAAETIVLRGDLPDVVPLESVAIVLPTCGLRGRREDARLVIDKAGS